MGGERRAREGREEMRIDEKGKGMEGKGREGKEREGKRREGKGGEN